MATYLVDQSIVGRMDFGVGTYAPSPFFPSYSSHPCYHMQPQPEAELPDGIPLDGEAGVRSRPESQQVPLRTPRYTSGGNGNASASANHNAKSGAAGVGTQRTTAPAPTPSTPRHGATSPSLATTTTMTPVPMPLPLPVSLRGLSLSSSLRKPTSEATKPVSTPRGNRSAVCCTPRGQVGKSSRPGGRPGGVAATGVAADKAVAGPTGGVSKQRGVLRHRSRSRSRGPSRTPCTPRQVRFMVAELWL